MADTVDSLVTLNGKHRYVIRLTNISDGTGESAVTKITKSALTNLYGVAPNKLCLVEVKWSIQGFTSVRLHWDATTDDEIVVLAAGNGWHVFEPALIDPASSGSNGNVLLTTAGAGTGATYSIELTFILA